VGYLLTEDEILGKRVCRARRDTLYTQVDLARKLSISSSQLYKFEKGKNRIPAIVLYNIAILCNRKLDWFFEDFKPHVTDASRKNRQ